MSIEHIQLLRGTAEALAAKNPVLLAGELGLETDTGRFKFGDGTAAWNSLSYAGGGTELPTNGVYIIKDGQYVQAQTVDMTTDWQPDIYNTQQIVVAVDEDMIAYQLTGVNVEVSE